MKKRILPISIYMLAEVDGIERIRFMTSHPKDLSDKLIAAYGIARSFASTYIFRCRQDRTQGTQGYEPTL